MLDYAVGCSYGCPVIVNIRNQRRFTLNSLYRLYLMVRGHLCVCVCLFFGCVYLSSPLEWQDCNALTPFAALNPVSLMMWPVFWTPCTLCHTPLSRCQPSESSQSQKVGAAPAFLQILKHENTWPKIQLCPNEYDFFVNLCLFAFLLLLPRIRLKGPCHTHFFRVKLKSAAE